MRSECMGHVVCLPGIQASVCYKTTEIQWCFDVSSRGVLQNEIDSLLLKRAIRVVPIEESQQGFYSCYFLIPKKGGSLRPILDLRVLNSHLRKYVQNVNSKSVVPVYLPR